MSFVISIGRVRGRVYNTVVALSIEEAPFVDGVSHFPCLS